MLRVHKNMEEKLMKNRSSRLRVLWIIAILSAIVLSAFVIVMAIIASDTPSGEMIKSHQVSMSGNLNLRFKYQSLGDAEGFKAEVYAPGAKTPKNTYLYYKKDIPYNESSKGYWISVPLAPSEMGYTVKIYPVRIKDNAIIGSGAVHSYSVAKYASSLMSSYDEYDDMLRAFLNWGAYSSVNFDGATEGLVNEGLFSRDSNPQSGVTSTTGYTQGAGASYGEGFKEKSGAANLMLKREDISLHFYVEYSGSEKLTATVSRPGKEELDIAAIDNKAVSVVREDDGRYSVRINRISINLFDLVYTVNIKAGDSAFTAQMSVLQYIDTMINRNNYTEAQKATARSLYQFYQLGTGKTGADSCDHGGINPEKNGDYYFIAAETEGESYYKCSHCFAQLGHGSFGDNVEYYLPAELVARSQVTGASLTKRSEGGKSYARVSDAGSSEATLDVLTQTGAGEVTGQYLIVKYRINGSAYSNSMTLTTNTTSASGTDGSTTVKADTSGDWKVMVVDLAARSSATPLKGEDGKYHINKLTVKPFSSSSVASSDYMDIAYIAFCDDIKDVKYVVNENEYLWSGRENANCTRNTLSNICSTVSSSAVTEEITTNADDTQTFSYLSCTSCETAGYTKTVAGNVTYFSPGRMNTVNEGSSTDEAKMQATQHFQMSNYGLNKDEQGTPYFTTQVKSGTNASQVIWMRANYDSYTEQKYATSIGNANYLIVKLRTSAEGQKFLVNVSTTSGEPDETISLPTSKTAAGEWGVYVIELEGVYGDAFTQGESLDGFYFTVNNFRDGETVDVAYMAFVEENGEDGKLSALDAIIDEKTAIFCTSRTESTVVNLEKGCIGAHKYSKTVEGGEYVSICSICRAKIRHGVRTSAADMFFPAQELVSKAGINGSVNITNMQENGVTFARYNNFGVNNASWFGIGYLSTNTAKTGQYLVIKLRVGENGLGSKEFTIYSNADSNTLIEEGRTDIKVTEDARWHTVVVDLKTRSKDPTQTWNTGTDMKHLSIRPLHDVQTSGLISPDDYVDIAYIATCDSLDDIKGIVQETGYELSDSGTSYILQNTADGSKHFCTAASGMPEIETLSNGDKVYTYLCGCGHVASERTVDAAVCHFMDAYDIKSHLKGNKLYNGYTSLQIGAGEFAPYAEGQNRQMLWCRSDKDHGDTSEQNDTVYNIGNARYLLMRVKSSVKGRGFDLSYSTKGYDGYGGVHLSLDEVKADTFITYVVDLKEILGNQHAKANGADDYVVDSFFWTFAESEYQNGTVAVDFIAFVENFTDIAELTFDRSVFKIQNKDGSGVFVDAQSGMCVDGHAEDTVISTENPDGSVTYTIGCPDCMTARKDVKPFTVPAGINYFAELGGMGNYQGELKIGEYDSVNSVIFNRYTTSETNGGYINITGGEDNGTPTVEKYTPGKYVVLKYRIPAEENRVNNYTLTAGTSADACTGLGTQSKAELPTEWRVAVFDTSGLANWPASSSELYFKLTAGYPDSGTTAVFDIAYLAVADNEDEIAELVSDEAYIYYGSNWSSAGKIKHLNAAYCTDADGDSFCDICGGDAVLYGNGGEIENAGHYFDKGAFALTDREFVESGAETISAEDLLTLLQNKEAVAGKTYRVTEQLVLDSDSYYGNLCYIIAERGILIEGEENVLLKDMIVKGNVTIGNSTNVTFNQVYLEAEGTAISVEGGSNIKIDDCVITSSTTAISSDADGVTVYKSRIIAGENGIISSGDELTVQQNLISAQRTGISSSGAYAIIKNNTLDMSAAGEGILLAQGSVNGLVALNTVKNAQNSITVENSFNCTVLLNSAVKINGSGNKNLYVVENSLGGLINLRGNKYLLCDENEFVSDGKYHAVISRDNTEYNGNGLQDVDAREDYGAKEELLPHTNKDLFVGMERLSEVRDADVAKTYSYAGYVSAMAAENEIVIVPPGAYTDGKLTLGSTRSYTTIYAYGVYHEKPVAKTQDGKLDFTEASTVGDLMGTVMDINGADSVHIHGLTLGYDFQSSGQAYVLEKIGEDRVRIIPSAGYVEAFAGSDTSTFSKDISATHGDEMYPWTNNVKHTFVTDENGKIVVDADGSMYIKITDPEIFKEIEVGDIFGCRLGGDNTRTLNIIGKDILMKDTVLYGYSAALAIVASGRGTTDVRLERHHNTAHSAPVIDEATYNRYKALEAAYGLNSDGEHAAVEGAQGLEVYIDEAGRYRGGLPRYGSVDATHIDSAEQGVSATSCIFENMVDDGSNQRSSSARVAGYRDNGDETYTIYYKGSLAHTYFNIDAPKGKKTGTPTASSKSFMPGDTIFAYASNGHTFVEAPVLTGSVNAGAIPDGAAHMFHVDTDKDCYCDTCGVALHYDFMNNSTGSYVAPDCKCDNCGTLVHTDFEANYSYSGVVSGYHTGNNKCNFCSTVLYDSAPTEKNGMPTDKDGRPVITDMASPAIYDPDTSELSYKIRAYQSKENKYYVIEYTTTIKAVKVKASDVDLEAVAGYDFTDNDYFMDDKVLCDNLTLNSAGFTFDNVLMQNYHSRGILMKTTDATVKNCTFRNIGNTGILMSIETTWGESTVPKNITIEGCLFDNTGLTYDKHDDLKQSAIAIQGLGDLSGDLKEVSEYTLPSRNINIIGNKFTNTNNNYCISMSAAQGITIKDNIFEMRKADVELEAGKAIHIDGCMNIEVGGNTYRNNETSVILLIDASKYSNLHGSDVEGKISTNSCRGEHSRVDNGDGTHTIGGCSECGIIGGTAAHKYIKTVTAVGEHKGICICGAESDERYECTFVSKLIDGKHKYVCACGEISDETAPHEFAEKIKNGKFTYVCACGEIGYSKVYSAKGDDSVTWFATPGMLNSGNGVFKSENISNHTSWMDIDKKIPTTHYHMQNTGVKLDADGMPYYTFRSDDTAQLIWMRSNKTVYEQYTTNIGHANLLVIKVRANNASQVLKIRLGTVNGTGAFTYTLPTEDRAAGEWTVYVLDLATVFGNAYVQGSELNNLYLEANNFTDESNIDIAYMAFVEGSWGQVDKLVDEKTVLYTANGKTVEKVLGESNYTESDDDSYFGPELELN